MEFNSPLNCNETPPRDESRKSRSYSRYQTDDQTWTKISRITNLGQNLNGDAEPQKKKMKDRQIVWQHILHFLSYYCTFSFFVTLIFRNVAICTLCVDGHFRLGRHKVVYISHFANLTGRYVDYNPKNKHKTKITQFSGLTK